MAQLLTQKEFAEQLGVSTAYISSLVKQGKLTLENGRLSTKSLDSMRADLIRQYNHLGTLVICTDDSADLNKIISDYPDYCKKEYDKLPEYIDSPAEFLLEIMKRDKCSNTENYNNDVVISLKHDVLSRFIKEYLGVVHRYFILLLTKHSEICNLPANLLYNFLLCGKDEKLLNNPNYIDDYSSILSSINEDITNAFYDLIWKYKLTSTKVTLPKDTLKYTLFSRSTIDDDFINLKGNSFEDIIARSNVEVLDNSNYGKILKKLDYKEIKELIKYELKSGYYSCYSISNISVIEGLISEDYYKHILVIGNKETFLEKLGDKCHAVLAVIKALKIDVNFIDSFN